ncbi:hypothetical protein CN203_27625 [Sinorhizobium meliloti]|uniref:hypothetical protein n=1 Tax=Rhizobium meliloti TaxID=382 RepID=UPI0002E4607B|nr:hypothetical protein [Sinorhizobium meliloti]RVH72557.1 hypothetical protein CN203_27625 [Sinorhizobium meliloti]
MSLPLLKSHPEATNFRFQACDMTDSPHGNAAEIVSAAACFGQLACISIRSTTFRSLFGS